MREWTVILSSVILFSVSSCNQKYAKFRTYKLEPS